MCAAACFAESKPAFWWGHAAYVGCVCAHAWLRACLAACGTDNEDQVLVEQGKVQ